MLSFGIDASRAFWTASASDGLPSMSPPPSRAATVIARVSLVKCWPRRWSTTAFLCLIEAHLECPDIASHYRSRASASGCPRYHSIVLRSPSSSSSRARQPVSCAKLCAVKPLPVDLRVRHAGATDLRRRRSLPARPADQRHHVADPVRRPEPALNASPRAPGVAEDRVADRQVRGDGVVDVQEITLGRAVGAQHRRASVQRRADRLRDQPGAVQVPSPVHVREPRDRDRQPERMPVGAGDQVGRGLRDVIRVERRERRILGVRQRSWWP